MNIVIYAFAFIYGAIIGSFLNVVIYRTPKGESLVKGSSHCTSCNVPIKNYDLIPIFSWLFLRGKCRHCKAKISPRYAIIETLTGFAFLISIIIFDFSFIFIISIILSAVLIVLSFIDIDTMEIPYWCSITIAALGIAMLIWNITVTKGTEIKPLLIEAGIGAICISLPFAALALINAMGGGDVQLMAAAGILLGYRIIPAAFIGIVLGAVGGIIVKIKSPSSKTSGDESQNLTQMVFGPYLAIGIFISFLFGETLINWYTQML